jgi:hypothetical protein
MKAETFLDLVRKAQVKYDALSPREKLLHRYEQRRSYIRGEILLDHENMTLEEANKLLDIAEHKLGITRP